MPSATTPETVQSPFRCDMSAIPSEQRAQHIRTAIAVFHAVEEIHELSNGFAFRLPNEATTLRQTIEFIALEKLCCPFFRFSVEIEPDAGPVWLQLTGEAGIKPFILAEIGSALPEAVTRASQLR